MYNLNNFKDIDSETVKVLAESERRGVLVNKDEGAALESRLMEEMEQLKRKAALLAGCNFDPNKPADVKRVIKNLNNTFKINQVCYYR